MNSQAIHVVRVYDKNQFADIESAAGNTYSQFGEDGLVDLVFARIGTANRWCFEVGASDGEFYSNTLRLRESGWNAVLVEAEIEQFKKLRRFASKTVRTVHKRIEPESLDQILGLHQAPIDLDLGVIDIDGQDYWAWNGLKQHKPRVMLVECAAGERESAAIPQLGSSGPEQAGAKELIELGKVKGYSAICRTFCNVLFVRDDQR